MRIIARTVHHLIKIHLWTRGLLVLTYARVNANSSTHECTPHVPAHIHARTEKWHSNTHSHTRARTHTTRQSLNHKDVHMKASTHNRQTHHQTYHFCSLNTAVAKPYIGDDHGSHETMKQEKG